VQKMHQRKTKKHDKYSRDEKNKQNLNQASTIWLPCDAFSMFFHVCSSFFGGPLASSSSLHLPQMN